VQTYLYGMQRNDSWPGDLRTVLQWVPRTLVKIPLGAWKYVYVHVFMRYILCGYSPRDGPITIKGTLLSKSVQQNKKYSTAFTSMNAKDHYRVHKRFCIKPYESNPRRHNLLSVRLMLTLLLLLSFLILRPVPIQNYFLNV
jgi:hypothetical protein